MDRVVPALLRADRPRAADVARLRPLGVVAALAVRDADRVDRREVEDVEAELGEARQLLAHALEAAPRAREELVPGAEARERAGRRRPRTSPTSPSPSGRPPVRRAPRRRSAPRAPRRTAPSDSSPARSAWPAATLRCSSSWNEATRSTHASTRKHQRPGPSTSNEPVQRSLPCGASGASAQRVEPGRRYRTAAPSVSCPSRKIGAATSTLSPTVRFTGQRPQSTCGSTAWIWIRARACLRERHACKSHR